MITDKEDSLRLILATANQNKVKEIRDIFGNDVFELLSLDDFDSRPPLEETGGNFMENAVQKAVSCCQFFGIPSVADDSGLEVDALGGAPGVFSARFAGPGADDYANNEKLLSELSSFSGKRRSARFRTVAACVFPDGGVITGEGVLEGRIIKAPRGGGGFGYDPLFVPKGMDKTCAELTGAQKNKISHRGQAFRTLKKALLERINEA